MGTRWRPRRERLAFAGPSDHSVSERPNGVGTQGRGRLCRPACLAPDMGCRTSGTFLEWAWWACIQVGRGSLQVWRLLSRATDSKNVGSWKCDGEVVKNWCRKALHLCAASITFNARPGTRLKLVLSPSSVQKRYGHHRVSRNRNRRHRRRIGFSATQERPYPGLNWPTFLKFADRYIKSPPVLNH